MNPRCVVARRNVCRLTAHINGVAYGVLPISLPPEATEVSRAWRLRKDDGTEYCVADTIDGATCECASFVFRHEGKDQEGCKHIKALRTLGLIDGIEEGADAWPSWTDSHAYTLRR